MQTPDEIRSDLPADLEPDEREPLVGLGARLQAGRPTPEAGFRAKLRGALLGAPTTPAGARPARRLGVRDGGRATAGVPARPLALAASYAAAGALLLAVAAAGLAGAGPFAPG